MVLASTKITVSVEESLKMSHIEWIAASAPGFKPVIACNGPADSYMSSSQQQYSSSGPDSSDSTSALDPDNSSA